MAQQNPASVPKTEKSSGDPWHAFGALVSGPVVYGMLGWGLDKWWGTSFLAIIGILLGVGLGLYVTWARFKPQPLEQAPARETDVKQQTQET